MSNNAIQNSAGLSKADKPNCRKYDNDKDNVETSSLYNDVRDLYKDEFEDSLLEYNSKQTRNDRKIEDYFSKISNDDKSDLACEIIIELGNKKHLETLLPDFKIANAIIHYDETIPHLHIIGVPIKIKNKYGMSK
ncbi:MAG: hypothetical protein ACK5HP_00465 [Bacilli bacterium]